MSLRFRFVFAGACAMLVALLCALYARHVRGEAERVRQESIERYGGEVVSLVVAPEGLDAGDVVGYGNVTQRDWLVDLAPEGAITSVDEALGMSVSVPVAPGAPVCELNVRDDSSMPDVPTGLVAVSLPLTDKLGLSRGVAQGSRLVAFEVSRDGARLISNGVQVVVAPAEQTGLAANTQVTVAAPPDDVPAILSASASGDLRLAVPATDVRMDVPADAEEGFANAEDVSPESEPKGDTADQTSQEAPEPDEVNDVDIEEVDA